MDFTWKEPGLQSVPQNSKWWKQDDNIQQQQQREKNQNASKNKKWQLCVLGEGVTEHSDQTNSAKSVKTQRNM